MDEYVGLPPDHPESYHSYMWEKFFKHIDINPANVNILDGNAEDLQGECDRVRDLVGRRERDEMWFRADLGYKRHHTR
jgi:glucosamine-6-phosphate deaminase